MTVYRKLAAIVGASFVIAAVVPAIAYAAPKVQEVFITNDASSPVPVAVQSDASSGPLQVESGPSDRDPYQKSVFFNQTATTCTNFVCEVAFDAVPVGKRLVITYASARWALTAGGTNATVVLGVNGNGTEDPQILLPAGVATSPTSFVAAGPVTFYAEAGDVPTLSLQGQFTQPVSNTAQAGIVGYFVPA